MSEFFAIIRPLLAAVTNVWSLDTYVRSRVGSDHVAGAMWQLAEEEAAAELVDDP
jgi:hypothetical protein